MHNRRRRSPAWSATAAQPRQRRSRKQIRPVIMHRADVMDRIFPGEVNRDA